MSSADNQQETPMLHRGILRDYASDTAHLSKDLTTLIALLYTDGCVSKHGVNSWRIYFSNSSLVAINLFVDSLVRVFEVPPERIQVKKKEQNLYSAILTSKEVGNFLTNSFGTFRTLKFSDGAYPDTVLPVGRLVRSNMVAPFLRVSFSMDGGVKFYPAVRRSGGKWLERNVFFACHHSKLREQYCHLLERLSIRPVNIEYDNVIKIRGRRNMERFAEKVGFVRGIKVTKHSKYWCGVEKNEVMRLMVESYRNPSKYLSLPNFVER